MEPRVKLLNRSTIAGNRRYTDLASEESAGDVQICSVILAKWKYHTGTSFQIFYTEYCGD